MITDKLHEECAVFGVSVHSEEAAGIVYNGLLSLQHRGQEGAGIAVLNGHTIKVHKDRGLVSEVFTGGTVAALPAAHMAVGHNRYSTTGTNTKENTQPFVIEFLTGRIAVVHNGNITNARKIRNSLLAYGIDFTASSDSEVLSALIAYYIVETGDTVKGVAKAVRELEGAFSLIVMTSDNKLIAVRDGYGFRPLCVGENRNGLAVSSESCALDTCGFNFLFDVAPGEMVVIQDCKIMLKQLLLSAPEVSMCIFEYVYFARTDSVIDGLGVHDARFAMGEILAGESAVAADAVCGVPDSGLDAAAGYAAGSGLPLISGFAKNRYVGRSFIFPSQVQRENAVRMKLNPMKTVVAGKRIVLVDDSIVRGTTSANIVKALKDAGATEVHLRISSPPFTHTCLFGTDIDTEKNLIANKLTCGDICKQIGADSLAYISVDGLKKACSKSKLSFCTRCFTGYKQSEFSECSKEEFE